MIRFYTFFDLGEEISAIGEKLIPNWFAFLVQLASLIVLLVVIFVFAYKPVKNLLDKRAEYIEKEVKNAEEKSKIADQNAFESERIINESRKKANEIIEDANNKAKIEAKKIIAGTEFEIVRMKEEARLDIEKSKAQSLEDIHNEMVDVALSASEEILKREVNKEDNERLAKDFIENLDK